MTDLEILKNQVRYLKYHPHGSVKNSDIIKSLETKIKLMESNVKS